LSSMIATSCGFTLIAMSASIKSACAMLQLSFGITVAEPLQNRISRAEAHVSLKDGRFGL
jgi:hypothetical protein